MKEQTAVEWLVEEINKLTGLTIQMDEPIIQQAKEMEREQNHAEYMRGWKDGLTKQQDK
jgi:predicted ATP-grasp superfamily ATP-dependent carboligase